MDAQTLTALKELAQTLGPYAFGALLLVYLVKRLIDAGYELHLKPTRRRSE